MSDQLFVGLAPKSDAGKEYMFYCMDDWIEMHKFIWSEIFDEFPLHPRMDGENAELLAASLQKALDFGIAHAYFLLMRRWEKLKEHDEYPDEVTEPEPWPDETSERVETMVGLLVGYIRFLRECGGFEVADCDYGP